MKLLIFCVETDPQANTDTQYIDKTVKHFYKIDNNIKIKYVYLCGKGNYDKKNKLQEINKLLKIKHFKQKSVIYCIDTGLLTDADAVEETKKIDNFCKSRGFEFAWFCEDIEQVFLHKKVNDCDKINQAKKFSASAGLCKATKQSLNAENYTHQKSNILLILDKYLN